MSDDIEIPKYSQDYIESIVEDVRRRITYIYKRAYLRGMSDGNMKGAIDGIFADILHDGPTVAQGPITLADQERAQREILNKHGVKE